MKISMVKIRITPHEVGAFGLLPAQDHDQQAIGKIDEGEVLSVDVKRQRNPRHHRLYWAVMSFVWQNHQKDRLGFEFYSKEQVSQYLLIRTMHIKSWMQFPDGTRVPITESISWLDMDQEGFQRYWDEATPIIEELMGMTIKEIERGIAG